MKSVEFAAGILAVWRLTHLLQAEDGPWQLSYRLRRAVGDGFWGQLLDCFYCLSLWLAAPVALLLAIDWRTRLLCWLGLSGGAILLQRLISSAADQAILPPAVFTHVGQEKSDVLLRKDAPAIGRNEFHDRERIGTDAPRVTVHHHF